MRNFWFPKSLAEYMTRQRFLDLGLTSAAVGVRDRTFGVKLQLDDDEAAAAGDGAPGAWKSKKEALTLPVSF